MDPTDMFGLLALVSLCGYIVGICLHAYGRESAQIVTSASSLALVLFGLAWGAFSIGDMRGEEFAAKRDLIAPLMSARFDKVCDRLGVIPNSDRRSNCFERGGMRVWRDNGRLYVASLLGPEVVTDLIVDEDRLLGGKFDAIIHLSDSLDLRRLPYIASSEG
jgi:hypothetical protein